MRLYSDNAQMTSKRGENKEVRYEPQASSVTDVLTTFSRPLCVIRVQTHGKMESICFIHCLDMVPYEILETLLKIFMLTICAGIEGQNFFLLRHL